MPGMDFIMNKEESPININQKSNISKASFRANSGISLKNKPAPTQSGSCLTHSELISLKEAASVVHQIRLSAQQELELARKMRTDAQRYQQETATKARSDAQQLLLRTRLATQRETEEIIRQAGEEIQKVLADIRMIRIMAQEELAAQRKFTDAARLRSMSLAIKDEYEKTDIKKKKQLTTMNK
jgi:hypothetical protein